MNFKQLALTAALTLSATLAATGATALEGFDRFSSLASGDGNLTFTLEDSSNGEGYVYGPDHLLFIRTFRIRGTTRNSNGVKHYGTFNESNSIPTRGTQSCNGNFNLYVGKSGDYLLEMNYEVTQQPFEWLSCDIEGKSYQTEMSPDNWITHYAI